MSSWRQSFEIVNQELELTRRKKQALDQLLTARRVSQPTYEHLEKGLTGTIRELEAQQRSLVDKMSSRADELEKQIDLLDLFITNMEIRHIAREIDEETYARQREAFMLGLEATKTELSQIRDSLTKIASGPA